MEALLVLVLAVQLAQLAALWTLIVLHRHDSLKRVQIAPPQARTARPPVKPSQFPNPTPKPSPAPSTQPGQGKTIVKDDEYYIQRDIDAENAQRAAMFSSGGTRDAAHS